MLQGIADKVVGTVERRITPQLERWSRMAGVRTDQAGGWLGELEFEFQEIRREFENTGRGQTRQIAESVATRTSIFNRAEITRQITGVLGMPVVAEAPNRDDLIDGFIRQNVSAIKSIPEQYLGEVERIINDGFRSGRRAEALAPAIAERGGITQRRARFIARDQIGSLNGQLTRARHKALGVEEYIWRTSLDERVRHSHAQLEGTRQSYDDPPRVGARNVHPGEDYNCRCTAEPVIEGVEIEETSPADVPPPLAKRPKRPARRTRARLRPRAPAPAPARVPERPPTPTRAEILAEQRRARIEALRRLIPTQAEAVTLTAARTGKPYTFTAEQALRAKVAVALAKREVRQAATTSQRLDRLLWNWVHGKRRRVNVEMRIAAAREFNLRGVVYNTKGYRVDELDVAQSAKDLRQLYTDTQAYYAQQGKRTVKVYRGVKAGRAGRGAIESWSTSEAVAKKFAGNEGHIITETVPVERVLTVRGGPHWLDGRYGNQAEIIIME
jgi:SPP1 gp7 family putative phage head morphogenesis protein